jgi:hypothetical protein
MLLFEKKTSRVFVVCCCCRRVRILSRDLKITRKSTHNTHQVYCIGFYKLLHLL